MCTLSPTTTAELWRSSFVLESWFLRLAGPLTAFCALRMILPSHLFTICCLLARHHWQKTQAASEAPARARRTTAGLAKLPVLTIVRSRDDRDAKRPGDWTTLVRRGATEPARGRTRSVNLAGVQRKRPLWLESLLCSSLDQDRQAALSHAQGPGVFQVRSAVLSIRAVYVSFCGIVCGLLLLQLCAFFLRIRRFRARKACVTFRCMSIFRNICGM